MTVSTHVSVEILNFLKQLVLTLKPELIAQPLAGVPETMKFAEGLRENSFGKVICCDSGDQDFAAAKQKLAVAGLGAFVEFRNQSAAELRFDRNIDMFYLVGYLPDHAELLTQFLPQMNPNGLIVVRDPSSKALFSTAAASQMEYQGLISAVTLPAPNGLIHAQKRAGRK